MRHHEVLILASVACACGSFDSAPSASSSSGNQGDAGGTGSTFCASRSGFDICADFDDPAKSPSAGWDAFALPNAAAPDIDSKVSRSPPSSLRIDVPAGASNLGLKKTVGAGNVFHIDAAVQLDQQPQDKSIDVLRMELKTAAATLVVSVDRQPKMLHGVFCSGGITPCVYASGDYDLHEWKTVAIDVDLVQSKARISVDGIVLTNGEQPVPVLRDSVTSMTAVVGPRDNDAPNQITFRLDDILVSHR